MAVSDPKITLKLLIDPGKKKVLYAEAGQDFIDLRLRPLLYPLGTMINNPTPPSPLGSIEKLYRTVEKTNNIYLVENRDKSSTLLQPRRVSVCPFSSQISCCCVHCRSQVIISDPNTRTNCYRGARSSCYNVNSGAGNGGAAVTYMIMDDLEIKPMSAISSITKKDVGLVEKTVVVGLMEIIALTQAAMKSSATALTDAFLNSYTKKSVSSV